MRMSITSTLVGLEDIVTDEYFFHVPIYQRLYVWGAEQVRTLLADLLAAYKAKHPIYYLGGALVVERDSSSSDGCQFDLIDGQQRFTTLWMLSLVCRESLTAFAYQQKEEDEAPRPRIRFPIRPEVDAFFARWIDAGMHELPCDASIIDALAHIETFFEEKAKSVNRARFADFVFRQVKLILTVVPPETDLNKLFELINNRGIQLQHHEILKARVLQAIADPATRAAHARLWDACAFMNDYLERNLRRQTGIRGTNLFDNTAADTDEESLASAEDVLEELYDVTSERTQRRSVTLEGILASRPRPQHIDEDEGAEEEDAEMEGGDEVRSIISFPMLLQHTLRIWLHEHGLPDLERILDKELLGIFGAHFLGIRLKEEDAKSFVRLLWEIRYLFDKHVIKWVRIADQEQHQIHHLTRRTEGRRAYLVREQPSINEGFALLQSMLYHSQEITTHYWLTPFLAGMRAHPGRVGQHFDYLRHLDNHLLCSNETDDLVVRSRRFLKKPWHRPPLDCSELSKAQGLGFRHYWFYKLEFVLWDRRPKGSDKRWASFRITAKNSIEHVSPQNPQDTDKNRVEKMLNRFGNLVLVSRSINSMYGNLPFNEKRQRFHNRNAAQLDSLKSARIYHCERWGDDEAKQHESEMIKLLKDYFKASPIPASHRSQ